VALAMDCFNAEMSAPRVTVSALMRRGWRQLEMQNVRVDAPAVASLNSKKDVVAGCISRLVRFLHV
jgi:hypothetical protein